MKTLSIAVTSYSRVFELERCLKSIDSSFINEIEVVVSEDCSPKKDEIKKLLQKISSISPYKIIFNSNEKNLGYDKNIKKLIDLSTSEYILFITDDDMFSKNSLDTIICNLKEQKPAFLLTPYLHVKTGMQDRKYERSHLIKSGLNSVNKYLFNSILVSGLIFKKSLIPEYHADKFDKLIYSQVYIFSSILYKNEGAYLNVNLIDCVEDGENAYGKSESNINKELANRAKPISNLEFNKGLIQIIRIFDDDYNENLHKDFSWEYSLRSWRGLSESKKMSQKEMNDYFKKLLNLDISRPYISYLYFLGLSILGFKITNFLLSTPKHYLHKYRKNI